MKTRIPGIQRTPVLLTSALAVTLALTLPPAPVSAQLWSDTSDCHCVDTDGDPIENCRCLRVPDRRTDVWPFTIWSERSSARLGVSVRTDQSSEHDGIGAHVTDVDEDSPAYGAGIRRGDVLVRVDGRSLMESLDAETEDDFDLDRSIPVQRLLAIIRSIEPGDEVDVEYRRGGELRAATVVAEDLGFAGRLTWADREGMERLSSRMRDLQSRSGAFGMVAPDHDFVTPGADRLFRLDRSDRGFSRCPSHDVEEEGSRRRANVRVFVLGAACPGGLELVELNPGLAGYFGTDGGVLVADVHPESPIALEPGDVILAVDDRAVNDVDQLRRILGSYAPDEAIRFRIMRRDREITVQGRLEQER